MKQQLIKLLAMVASILLSSRFCLPAKADAGAVAAQGANNMMRVITNNHNNEKATERNSQNGGSNNDSEVDSLPTFSRNPAITKEIIDQFINNADTPSGKKFLTKFLTLRNMIAVFSDTISTNNVADAYAVASLTSFMTIEDKVAPLSKEQIRNTKQKFRKVFTSRPTSNASKQRTGERMLYWTMLMLYYNKSAQNPQEKALVKSNLTKMMASIGLSPQKYTLGSQGIVEK